MEEGHPDVGWSESSERRYRLYDASYCHLVFRLNDPAKLGRGAIVFHLYNFIWLGAGDKNGVYIKRRTYEESPIVRGQSPQRGMRYTVSKYAY